MIDFNDALFFKIDLPVLNKIKPGRFDLYIDIFDENKK